MNKSKTPYSNTKVTWLMTQGQLISLLAKYGITDTRFTNYGGHAYIEFILPEKRWPIRLSIPIDSQDLQRTNVRWRMLYWYLKAKMEAMRFGIANLETEWLPFIAIGDKTVAEQLIPELEKRGLKGEAFKGLLTGGDGA